VTAAEAIAVLNEQQRRSEKFSPGKRYYLSGWWQPPGKPHPCAEELTCL